jgi:hypothetical protein
MLRKTIYHFNGRNWAAWPEKERKTAILWLRRPTNKGSGIMQDHDKEKRYEIDTSDPLGAVKGLFSAASMLFKISFLLAAIACFCVTLARGDTAAAIAGGGLYAMSVWLWPWARETEGIEWYITTRIFCLVLAVMAFQAWGAW